MNTFKLGRLLVVDDESELMSSLCETLAKVGYETVGLASGEDALAALKEQSFDLLLTDLMMPGMDGIALLQEALKIEPHLVGIVMTGQGTVETAVDAMKVGAFDYVLKPFRMKTLLPALSRAMQMRRVQAENFQLREATAIYELTRAISFTFDLDLILNKIVDAALQQCEADEASIMLPIADKNELYVAVARGDRPDFILGKRVRVGESVAGWVAAHKTPVVLEGKANDPRFLAVTPRDNIRSSVSMPMLVGGQFVGVLNVNLTKQRRTLSLGQVKALTILASIAASAIESAYLYTQARQAEEKYRSIYENAVEGILQTSPEGNICAANPALTRLLGYDSPEELMARVKDVATQLYSPPERHREFQQLIAKCEVVHGFECQVRRKDGQTIWVSISSRLVRDAQGAWLYCESMVQDITEKKHVQAQLLRAQRLESVGRLASGIAHDLNNVLTPILVGLTLLHDQAKDDRGRRLLDTLKVSTERGANIIKQLLTFARGVDGQKLPVQLRYLIKETAKIIRETFPKSLTLNTKLADELRTVSGDATQLHQMLLNLCVNARDAMPQGGTLTLSAENVQLDESFVQMTPGAKPGPHVLLLVADTGIGIPPENLDKIFDPFFTTKGPDKGTGLGLSTVLGIVKNHDGFVKVLSTVGQGSQFKIYLPAIACPESTPPQIQPPPLPGAQGELVLVVEDEASIREVIQKILEQQGYRVLTAAEGTEAIALYAQKHQDIKLVLTDMSMPFMDGATTMRALRKMNPQVNLIAMSGLEPASECQGLRIQAFLRKPFTAEQLLAALHEARQGNEPAV